MQEKTENEKIITPENQKKEIPLKNATGNFDISQVDPVAAAVFSYLIPLIGGFIFFFTEKKNKFVKFHAFQSILFWAVVIGFNIVVNTIFGVFISFRMFFIYGLLGALMGLVAIPIFGIWLFLMWKAYSKEEFELPYIGKFAKQQAEKKD